MSSSTTAPVNVLITGWSGLLGFHMRSVLMAHNCACAFKGDVEPYVVKLASRIEESTVDILAEELQQADLVLHFAGINRANDEIVEHGNIELAHILVDALMKSGNRPHVIYANTTHSLADSPYGRGKRVAHEILSEWALRQSAVYTNVILPHIFGENSVPFYNTVTATLCQQVVDGTEPTINPDGHVDLLHSGDAVDVMLRFFENGESGTKSLSGQPISIADLYDRIVGFKTLYDAGQYPDLTDHFAVKLFNTYRSFEFPQSFPRALTVFKDSRGMLFEAVKGGGGGQTFLSWTEPGVERGNHFHRHKVERFLVVSGQADIRVRKLFSEKTHTYSVNGDNPEIVDMPTLHTHSVINTGDQPVLTLFWAHELFDPEHPDTYAHTVDIAPANRTL